MYPTNSYDAMVYATYVANDIRMTNERCFNDTIGFHREFKKWLSK